MRKTSSLIFLYAVIGLLLTGHFGCGSSSSTNKNAGFDANTGKHRQNWIIDHRAAYLSDTNSCAECHGADLLGGIASVSCFSPSFGGASCHANGPGHADPASWRNPEKHGASAKAAPNGQTQSGFEVCRICHGTTFQGNGASIPACSSCHGGSAPHPVSWITQTYIHRNTDPGNATVCSRCHLKGANSPIAPPSPPAAAGTAPGCFNNTLCHASSHGADWANPSVHGAAAKAAPNAATVQGFSSCQTCHGADFSGGTSGTSCPACHGGSAPHPSAWRPDDTYRHTSTNQANAPVCAECHRSIAGTPGCFNNTLCHGSGD